MKKLLALILALFVWYVSLSSVSALTFFDSTSTVYTQNEQKAVKTDDICASDPLRCGMNNAGSGVQGIYYTTPITTTYQAQNQTLAYVHNLINWGLSLLWLVALCYLLYYGFLIVFAAGDDAKVKKWWGGMRTAAIAIAGIALSWDRKSVV